MDRWLHVTFESDGKQAILPPGHVKRIAITCNLARQGTMVLVTQSLPAPGCRPSIASVSADSRHPNENVTYLYERPRTRTGPENQDLQTW